MSSLRRRGLVEMPFTALAFGRRSRDPRGGYRLRPDWMARSEALRTGPVRRSAVRWAGSMARSRFRRHQARPHAEPIARGIPCCRRSCWRSAARICLVACQDLNTPCRSDTYCSGIIVDEFGTRASETSQVAKEPDLASLRPAAGSKQGRECKNGDGGDKEMGTQHDPPEGEKLSFEHRSLNCVKFQELAVEILPKFLRGALQP